MRLRQTTEVTSLPTVRSLHRANGPSLPMGRQLYWTKEPEIIFAFLVVCPNAVFNAHCQLLVEWPLVCII